LRAYPRQGRWPLDRRDVPDFFHAQPDILPVDDVGLQRAMSLHYNSGKPLSKLKIRQIALAWQPWRTVATWYLWQSLDPIPARYP
jgi:DNA-3-methyladenine glycosylase II